jgi:antitoxin (DNA-binding transcriptional repressor) of toxin-antitoxin stability system
MKTISLAEAETDVKSFLYDIASGNELTITNDKNEEKIAVIIPYEKWETTSKRRLGTLQKRGSVVFEDDFSMTAEELVGL